MAAQLVFLKAARSAVAMDALSAALSDALMVPQWVVHLVARSGPRLVVRLVVHSGHQWVAHSVPQSVALMDYPMGRMSKIQCFL